MSEETPATSPEQESNNTLDLNLVELTNLAVKLLDQLFVQTPKDKAKPLFKDLKLGNTVALGTVTIQEKIKPSLQLALDYSEYVGPGFNYDVFTTALKGILLQISRQFKKKDDLNVMFTEDNRSMIIHLPGMVQLGEQLNAMVLGFDLGNLQNITIKLMFIEPSQYEAVRKEATE